MSKKAIIWGVIASTGLLTLYLTILTISNSFKHAIEQLIILWYWMIPLIIGFGIQTALYAHIREETKKRNREKIDNKTVIATGGISTTSMIACCAHHITDLAPILGLTAATIFLARHQTTLLLIGILSNIIGLNVMLHTIQKHKIYDKKGILNKLMRIDMKKALKITIILSAGIIITKGIMIII